MNGEQKSLDVSKLRSAVRTAGLTSFLAAGGATSQAFADCWFCTSACVACTSCVSSSGPTKSGP